MFFWIAELLKLIEHDIEFFLSINFYLMEIFVLKNFLNVFPATKQN